MECNKYGLHASYKHVPLHMCLYLTYSLNTCSFQFQTISEMCSDEEDGEPLLHKESIANTDMDTLMRRCNYSPEMKRKVLRCIKASCSVTDVSRTFKLRESTVYRWIREAGVDNPGNRRVTK